MTRPWTIVRALALVASPLFTAATDFTVSPIPDGRTLNQSPYLVTMNMSTLAIPMPSTFVTVVSPSLAASPSTTSSSVAPYPVPANATAIASFPTTAASASALHPCFGVPVTYTVVHLDTVEKIAAKFNITVADLEAANQSKVLSWDLLEDGTQLEIPLATCSPYSPTAAYAMTMSTAVSPFSATSTSSSAPAVTSLVTFTSSSQLSPQSTPSGPVTAWTVESGDTGGRIASEVSVPFFAISSANPMVAWTAITVGQTLAIPPSPTALAQVTGTLAEKTMDTGAGNTIPQVMYKEFDGDGSVSAGWPRMSDWLSFDAQFENIKDDIGQNCGDGVPSNSDAETDQLKNAILTVGADAYLDVRFLLSVVMQESNGCVRVKTTSLANPNPGLLQSFNGKGSCNHNGTFDTPCPAATIQQMIMDGVGAPIDGVTLVTALNKATAIEGCEPAQAFYRAARYYNSGPDSLPPEADNDLGSDIEGATQPYSSNVANRLIGWTNGKIGLSPYTLDRQT